MPSKKQPGSRLKTPYEQLRKAAATKGQTKQSLASVRIVFALLGVIAAIVFYRYPNILDTIASSKIYNTRKKITLAKPSQ